MTEFLQLVVDGLITGSIFALAGIGVSLPYAILRVVNFAQGEYVTYGAYCAVLVNIVWRGNIALATLAAVGGVAALSVILEFGFWRPMRNRRAGHFTMLLASFGLSLVMRGALFIVGSSSPRTYRVNVFQVYDIGGIRLSESELIAVVLGFLAITLIALLFAKTHTGRTMRALADDRALAAVAGVNTDRLVVITWLVTGVLAGLAGVLQGLLQNSFDPNMGGDLLLPVFAAVILGGVGSAYGVLAGGLLVGVAMQLSTWSVLWGGLSPIWQQVVAFSALVIALLIRPQGLLGQARLT
jgi:branched-subunit amino acid ABC-type transport system permease component